MEYTCSDYRQEMILLGLKRRLQSELLTPENRERLIREIHRLEKNLDLG